MHLNHIFDPSHQWIAFLRRQGKSKVFILTRNPYKTVLQLKSVKSTLDTDCIENLFIRWVFLDNYMFIEMIRPSYQWHMVPYHIVWDRYSMHVRENNSLHNVD